MRSQLDELLVDAQLLPAAFTMPELQQLHETVLGRALDPRNFQKRMLETGLVERLPELRVGGAEKADVHVSVGGEGRVAAEGCPP